MQLEIYSPTQAQPLPPVEWNYAELKQWVSDGLEAYRGRVYTEDTVTEAKRDRATLNKLAQAIEDRRREIKAVYLAPYDQFEKQAKELVGMVKDQSREIDAQIKTYDRQRREEKLEHIKTELYAPMIGDLAEAIAAKDRILAERETMMLYARHLEAQNATRAAQDSGSMEQHPTAEKPAEARETAHDDEPVMQLDFRAWVTRSQMLALREFLVSNGIKFGKVPRESEV